jgi:hypothetical protein
MPNFRVKILNFDNFDTVNRILSSMKMDTARMEDDEIIINEKYTIEESESNWHLKTKGQPWSGRAFPNLLEAIESVIISILMENLAEVLENEKSHTESKFYLGD